MAQEIFCPNCGGLIFSSDPDALHMQPCTCTATESPAPPVPAQATVSSRAESTARPESSAAVSAPSRPATSSEPKICVKCGRDVNGHRRYKDDDGNYWCLPCAKEDEKRKRAQSEPAKSKCAMCGEEVAVMNLIALDGRFCCPRCVRETRELAKKTEARIGRINSAYKGQDWKRLAGLLGVLALLGIIILLRTLGLIGGG
jgi:DNA-directed RNA polymerase subunit RPC12/RpoP